MCKSLISKKNQVQSVKVGLRIEGIRLYATASNLFTITPYKGYDPEVSSGTDSGAYPASRTFTFGVNVTL